MESVLNMVETELITKKVNKLVTIGELSIGRKNNFDFIRFLAATLVLLSHSYPLSGDINGDILFRLSNGQWDLGGVAVGIFFIISGYLITNSFVYSKNIMVYLKSRILRIFPGLIGVLLFSSLILGPFVTSLTINDYFHNNQTYNYLKAMFLYPLEWNLPGVFENNAYKSSVNGSLWTIPFEFMFYLFVAVLGLLGLFRFKTAILVIFILINYALIFKESVLSMFPSHFWGLEVKTIIELFAYFTAGMTIFIYRNLIVLDKHFAMLSIIVLFLSANYGGMKELFVFFGSYLILYFSYNPKINFSSFSKYGDFSYGLYLYAFPVQQLVTYMHGGKMQPIINFAIAFPSTLILAIFSWCVIEKRFLSYKKINVINVNFLQINVVQSIKGIYSYFMEKLVLPLTWKKFLFYFMLFLVFFIYFNQKPSKIVFPYTKSQSIFHGGWLAQGKNENYRWIEKEASVELNQPSNAKKINIEGFLPEMFTEINKMTVFINNREIGTLNIKAGQPILFNQYIGENTSALDKRITVKIAFNDIHKPDSNSPDLRRMSALINKISIY